MQPKLFHRTTAMLVGAAMLLGATLVASPAATAIQAPSGYALTFVSISPNNVSGPEGVAVDANGTLYIANTSQYNALKVTANGTTTQVAGMGDSGQSTAGPALDSLFGQLQGVAADSNGNFYLTEMSAGQIVKVTSGGTLSFIGSGFSSPRGIIFDSSGNLYIADTGNHKVKKMTPGGTITTIAGTGTAGAPTEGTATSSALRSPSGVAVDSSGNVYIADSGNHRIEKVTPEGVLSIIAGTGTSGAPTAGAATSSNLNYPRGVAVDASGNVFIADTLNNRIEKVTPGGILSIIAGTGTSGAPTVGDGASSKLWNPSGIAVDSNGIVYVADTGNSKIEKLVSSVSAPAAPTALSATPGDTTASVSFTASSDGGGAITKYQYTTNDGGSWTDAAAGTTSPLSITGLTNDTTYSIKIRAYNSAGGGAASSAVSVTPTAAVSAPSAPTSLGATPGAGSASITFTAGFNGGGEITKYQYTTNDGGSWTDAAAGTTSPLSITGLTNGTTYNIKIRAYNSAGGGSASASAVSVTPRTTPSAPTALFATPGNGSATISFTPGFDGGSSILRYAYSTDGGSNWDYLGLGDGSPQTITGLTNGTSYSIRLKAINLVGGGASSTDVPVTPRSVPWSPLLLEAIDGDTSASIVFTPGSDGGSAITKYQYQLDGGAWVDAVGTTSPIRISGLTNFTTYTVRLRAVNAAGAGSSVGWILTRPKSGGPTIGVAYSSGKQGAFVGFAFDRPAGSTLVGFTVRAYAKGTTTVVSSCQTLPNGRSCYIPSLTSGTEYDIRVQAYFTFAGETKVRASIESATSRVRVNS